ARCCAFVALTAATAGTSAASHATQSVVYAVAKGRTFVYDAPGGKLAGTLQQPSIYDEWVAVDGAQNVYVAASTGPYGSKNGSIREYAPGSSEPSRVMQNGKGYINAMAASNSGEVVTAQGVQEFSTLRFFAPGATSPTRTIVSPFGFIPGAAYEPDGTLWLDGLLADDSYSFGYVPAGGTEVTLVAFPGSPPAGPIVIDPTGNIVVEARGALMAYSASGKLQYTVRLAGRPDDITAIALSKTGTILYIADPNLQIEEFHFPQGGPPIRAFGQYSTSIATGSI
ncbi:MAG: hypothetical protein IAI50_21320, partial [Candidatus Eremiobacteraeota bacterium]|nr:hypothetical protein [Candidatus Eremiobacteraeota bacterium]